MKNRYKGLLALAASLAVVIFATRYRAMTGDARKMPDFLYEDGAWIEASMNRLSPEALGSQMLWLSLQSSDLQRLEDSAGSFYEQFDRIQPGGILFENTSPEQTRRWARLLQRRSRQPLLVGIRQDTLLMSLPSHLAAGAIADPELIGQMGEAMAAYAKAVGAQLYLLPEPPRSLSDENRSYLAARMALLQQGLLDRGILSCLAEVSDYYPAEKDSLRRMARMLPLATLSRQALPALMAAPQVVSSLHLNSGREAILQEWFEEHCAYEGLLLAPLGGSEQGRPEEQVAQGLKSGADILVLPLAQAEPLYYAMDRWQGQGWVTEAQLRPKVRRQLQAKAWVQAAAAQQRALRPFESQEIPDFSALRQKLAAATLTLAKDEKRQVPFFALNAREFQLVSVGEELPLLVERMQFYAAVRHLHLPVAAGQPLPALPVDSLAQRHPVIVAIGNQQLDSLADEAFLRSLRQLGERTPLLVLHFGDLAPLRLLGEMPTLLQSYGSSPEHQSLAAEILFGGAPVSGILPLDAGPQLAAGSGFRLEACRLGFSSPAEAGFDPAILRRIDTIAQQAIRQGATPGCQVLVARRGKVVLHEAYGSLSYEGPDTVNHQTIYDIASITKVAATTLAAMKLYEEGRLDLGAPLAQYFHHTKPPEESIWVRDTLVIPALGNGLSARPRARWEDPPAADEWLDTLPWKRDSLMVIRAARRPASYPLMQLTLAELLTHRSGLPASLGTNPFVDSLGRKSRAHYSDQPQEPFTIAVADKLYLRKDYIGAIWREMRRLEPDPAKPYIYSDVNMILLQQVIDSLNQEPLDRYLARTFYGPLGMHRTLFNPLQAFPEAQIAPTEADYFWRDQVLRGYVHDPTAALFGGVAGNAGLFSTAGDLAHLFQLFLNGGSYGGDRYLKPETLALFTRRQAGHRALGFDMPPLEGNYLVSPQASPRTYGHTGFTGTCVWADPDEELIFIFLSNRVHPSADNWRLNLSHVRERMHDAVYESLRAGRPKKG